MDKITELVSSLGLFRNNSGEGDCFNEPQSGNSSSNPLSIFETHKKNIILVVVAMLLGFTIFYLFYGDETENIMNSFAESVQKWVGSLILSGGYLTSSGELKTTKILDAPKLDVDVGVDVNEMLML